MLDYVLIVTPNHVHYDPAMKALKAGLPVFCEKPLLTAAAGLVLRKGVAATRRRAEVCQHANNRYLDALAAASKENQKLQWYC